MAEPRRKEAEACQMWTHRTDQKVANMETSVVAALLFLPCRAFADICFREKVQLTCLAENLES